MKSDEDYIRLLPDFRNPNATIFIRNVSDRKYVWVNHEFQRDHRLPYDHIIGKTQIDIFGKEACKPWELSDALTVVTGTPTTTVESYGERRYGLTKFIATDRDGVDYLVGIGVEIKASSRSAYDKRLRELTDLVLSQLREIVIPQDDGA